MLLERDYPPGIINAAIARAKAIPQEQALRLSLRQQTNNRPVFVVSFDPRLPSIPKITRKHWRSMISQDTHLEEVFKEAPLIAFKRQSNIRESLIKAKIAPKRNMREKKNT